MFSVTLVAGVAAGATAAKLPSEDALCSALESSITSSDQQPNNRAEEHQCDLGRVRGRLLAKWWRGPTSSVPVPSANPIASVRTAVCDFFSRTDASNTAVVDTVCGNFGPSCRAPAARPRRQLATPCGTSRLQCACPRDFSAVLSHARSPWSEFGTTVPPANSQHLQPDAGAPLHDELPLLFPARSGRSEFGLIASPVSCTSSSCNQTREIRCATRAPQRTRFFLPPPLSSLQRASSTGLLPAALLVTLWSS